jgi:hypothetical protein
MLTQISIIAAFIPAIQLIAAELLLSIRKAVPNVDKRVTASKKEIPPLARGLKRVFMMRPEFIVPAPILHQLGNKMHHKYGYSLAVIAKQSGLNGPFCYYD